MQPISQNGFLEATVLTAIRAKHRAFAYPVELLDYSLSSSGYLAGVSEAKVDVDADRNPITATFTCTLDIALSGTFDFYNSYLRPWVWIKMAEVGTDGDAFAKYAQGIFKITAAKKEIVSGGATKYRIEAHDLTELLDGIDIEESFAATTTDKVTDKIKAVLDASPMVGRYNITASSELIQEAKSWEPGTTLLKIIDDLCALIDYVRYVDVSGILVVEPWHDPATHNAQDSLSEADDLIFTQASLSQDIFKLPNEVVLISASPEREGVVWKRGARVINATSPISQALLKDFTGAPLVRKKVMTNVDAASIDALQDKADRQMLDIATIAETYDGSCAIRPWWGFRDVVSVTRADLGFIADKFEVRKWGFAYSVEAKQSFTMKRSISLS